LFPAPAAAPAAASATTSLAPALASPAATVVMSLESVALLRCRCPVVGEWRLANSLGCVAGGWQLGVALVSGFDWRSVHLVGRICPVGCIVGRIG
jgi:hypothetical protein